MTEELWTAVDRYFSDLLVSADPALEAALAASASAGLPAINVSPVQGKLLHVLAQSIGARNILEIGTLGGYSTIWLARALPDGGRVISLEADPRHAEVARANIARAGLDDRVEVRLGMALDLLPGVAAEGGPPFDFVFIDADKASYPAYYEALVPRLAPHGLMALDNTLWSGAVAEPADSPQAQMFVELNARIASDPRVVAVVLTVRDGVTLVRRAG